MRMRKGNSHLGISVWGAQEIQYVGGGRTILVTLWVFDPETLRCRHIVVACQSPTHVLTLPETFCPSSVRNSLDEGATTCFVLHISQHVSVIRSPSSTQLPGLLRNVNHLGFGFSVKKWNNNCWTYQRIHRRWSDGRLPGACSAFWLSLFHCVRSLAHKTREIQLLQVYHTQTYVNTTLWLSHRVISCFGACDHPTDLSVLPLPCSECSRWVSLEARPAGFSRSECADAGERAQHWYLSECSQC